MAASQRRRKLRNCASPTLSTNRCGVRSRPRCDSRSVRRVARSQRSEFPSECSEIAHVERIKTAFPIHLEVFDRLYQEWSTVERFQRTCGVLRMMAATIHSLWESDDKSPLILPCSVPLVDTRVSAEPAGKLPEYWQPVSIDADIDGPGSRSAQVDREIPHLGAATRHTTSGPHDLLRSNTKRWLGKPGLEVERIRLGSTFAGEKPGPIADALTDSEPRPRTSTRTATATGLTVSKTSTEPPKTRPHSCFPGRNMKCGPRSNAVLRDTAQRNKGAFVSVHVAPATSDDVADDPRCRLVVLGAETPTSPNRPNHLPS